MSAEDVKGRLGEPKREEGEGNTNALSYGIWQLTFVRDHLTTRSKVIVRPNGRPIVSDRNLNKAVRHLELGSRIGAVEAKLGTPEAVYVIYEAEPQPVRILRYGSWELTFVHRMLSQRAQ